MEWFNSLSTFEQIYWGIALISTVIFVFVLIGTFVLGDVDELDGVDAEVESDFGIDFQFVTFKNLVAFFTIFGWAGISSIQYGNSTVITIILSTICGLIMMLIMASLYYYMSKLTSSGTLQMKNALNSIGEVYTTIGANQSSMGKVQINVQGSLRELDALTNHNENLTQGKIVKVKEITSNGILIVQPQN